MEIVGRTKIFFPAKTLAVAAVMLSSSYCFGEIKEIELAELIKQSLIDSNSNFHTYMSINEKIGPFKTIYADTAPNSLKSIFDKYNNLSHYRTQYIINFNGKNLGVKDIAEAAEWDVVVSGSKATPTHLFVQSDHFSREDYIPNVKYFSKYGVIIDPIICSVQSGRPVNNTGYYTVKSKNKNPALLIIESGSGSAGNSFRLELTWESWDLRDIIKNESYSLEDGSPIKVGLCELNN